MRITINLSYPTYIACVLFCLMSTACGNPTPLEPGKAINSQKAVSPTPSPFNTGNKPTPVPRPSCDGADIKYGTNEKPDEIAPCPSPSPSADNNAAKPSPSATEQP